jgi:predicted ATP-grasp superfamily ATP-dependent carboligase/protein-tyrosine-phosphatase
MNTDNPKRVLVLDADVLPALAIVRSLGREGIKIDVASHIDKPICKYSKYVCSTQYYPNPLQETDAFTNWIETTVKSNRYLLIIPSTERTLVPISLKFGDMPYFGSICMPGQAALETVLDKSKTSKLAEDLGIPQPLSWHIDELHELEKIQNEVTFPIVIKPGRSIAESTSRISLTVRYAHTHEELEKTCKELLTHVHVVLQEYFTGAGTGIELIASHGEILYAFQHLRLHEVPLSGGGSSYRSSVKLDPELLDASKKLIRALNWHGVAMVEFKKDLRTGDFVLIEINGRFWGSLPLATAAGADFPHMLYQLYTMDEVTIPPPYRLNIKCRKLSSDLAWIEAILRKDADQRLVTIPTIGSAIKDAIAVFSPRHYFDAQSLSDIKPGFIDFKKILVSYFVRFTGVIRDWNHKRDLIKRSHFSKIEVELGKAKNILFICYGNINRSALAEILAANLSIDREEYNFKSAGFHPINDRPADSRMVRIASQHGHDLSEIRSNTLSNDLIHWADLIFVMETEHIDKLLAYSDLTEGKCFLLGGILNKRKAVEIPDPYNKSNFVYKSVYSQIDQAINILKELLVAVSTRSV